MVPGETTLLGRGDPLVEAEHPESQKGKKGRHQEDGIEPGQRNNTLHWSPPGAALRMHERHLMPIDGLIG